MSKKYRLELQNSVTGINFYQSVPKSQSDKIIRYPGSKRDADSVMTNALTFEQNPIAQSKASLSSILKNYEYNAEVEAFIALYPFLQSTLLQAYQQVHSIFGASLEKIVLKVVHDPEIPNYEHLVGYVWADASIEEARQMLDEFDDNWYLSLSYEKRRIFYFTIRAKK
jgi:hypothetical protein